MHVITKTKGHQGFSLPYAAKFMQQTHLACASIIHTFSPKIKVKYQTIYLHS